MNKIFQRTITISFDVWEPFEKQVLMEINDMIVQLKERKLLAHAGNVKLTDRQEND